MQINLVIKTKNKTEVYDTVEKIHNSLAGNQDYIDSNIILNFDNSQEPQIVTLVFNEDKCQDREYVRKKAKEAINAFINDI